MSGGTSAVEGRCTGVMARARRLLSVIAVAAAVVSCGGAYAPSGAVDVECASAVPTHESFDAGAFECFWSAYTAGRSARLSMTLLTVEGDPIRSWLTYSPAAGLEVVKDISADKFRGAGQPDLLRWKCTTVAKHPWATDPSRFAYELSGCTGQGESAGFP